MGSQIPVRTYNDGIGRRPAFEIDLVAHCGGTLSGSFIHSLVANICTGWTEAVPLLAKQSLVVEGLKAIARSSGSIRTTTASLSTRP